MAGAARGSRRGRRARRACRAGAGTSRTRRGRRSAASRRRRRIAFRRTEVRRRGGAHDENAYSPRSTRRPPSSRGKRPAVDLLPQRDGGAAKRPEPSPRESAVRGEGRVTARRADDLPGGIRHAAAGRAAYVDGHGLGPPAVPLTRIICLPSSLAHRMPRQASGFADIAHVATMYAASRSVAITRDRAAEPGRGRRAAAEADRRQHGRDQQQEYAGVRGDVPDPEPRGRTRRGGSPATRSTARRRASPRTPGDARAACAGRTRERLRPRPSVRRQRDQQRGDDGRAASDSSIAPSTCTNSARFTSTGRIAASTSCARLPDHQDQDGAGPRRSTRACSRIPSRHASLGVRRPPAATPRERAPGRARRSPLATRPRERARRRSTPSQTWYASRSIASQTPNTTVPSDPDPIDRGLADRPRPRGTTATSLGRVATMIAHDDVRPR